MTQCPANVAGRWARFKERQRHLEILIENGGEHRRVAASVGGLDSVNIVSLFRTSYKCFILGTRAYVYVVTAALCRKDHARTRRK